MALEVARRLIDNVWRTVIADEGADSGGSITLPATISGEGELNVSPTGDGADVDAVLRVTGPANLHGGSGDGYYFEVKDDDGTSVFNLDPSGTIQLRPTINEGSGGPSYIVLSNTSGFNTTEFRSGGLGYDRITISEGSDRIFRVGPLGEIGTKANSAPADNTLIAGECVMWFDKTNGAAKVMFKGKSANGTVVTGNVPLT